jgi:hypothetical protein
MKFCKICNKKYHDKENFCGECGNKLVDEIIRCNNCNAEIKIGNKYCYNCGKNLREHTFGTSVSERVIELKSISNHQKKRYDIFRKNLEELLKRGKKGFVIFEEKNSKMFVQFHQEVDKLILAYPPFSILFNREHTEKLKEFLEKEKIDFEESDFIYADFGNNIELTTYLIERIFKEVFGFNDDYEIRVELSLEG